MLLVNLSFLSFCFFKLLDSFFAHLNHLLVDFLLFSWLSFYDLTNFCTFLAKDLYQRLGLKQLSFFEHGVEKLQVLLDLLEVCFILPHESILLDLILVALALNLNSPFIFAYHCKKVFTLDLHFFRLYYLLSGFFLLFFFYLEELLSYLLMKPFRCVDLPPLVLLLLF